MSEDIITAYLSRIGKRGGKSRSKAKLRAVGQNLKQAQAARRKQRRYPPCPKYKNHAHRFSPKGVCYGCRFKRKIKT